MNPADPSSFTHKYAYLNNIRYHYVDEGPRDGPVILACHGFPDLWFGWRHHIPILASKGYRVIVPDLLGFGQTDAPHAPEIVPLTRYGHKSVAKDLMALLDQLGIDKVILLGHDWGGQQVWRTYFYYPERIIAIMSLCTPYLPPATHYTTLEEFVELFPAWEYQLYFNTPEAEVNFDEDPETFFRNALNTSCSPNTLMAKPTEADDIYVQEFSSDDDGNSNSENSAGGEKPKVLKRGPLLTEAELGYYASEFGRRGFHGGLNWYKTRRVNFDDELPHADTIVKVPCLMVTAELDFALPPEMASSMHESIPDLTMRAVKDTGHWIMTEKKDEVTQHICDFLDFKVASKTPPLNSKI
ncbi:alpha/beta-hydrolase [Ramicandelaber brevisporus]|nr:alpha/beta-hydrolase [Ramicandelaber brevisporus]